MSVFRQIMFSSAAAASIALGACGGGGTTTATPVAVAAPVPVVSVPSTGSDTFVVTNAAVASRNGTFKVSSALGFLPAGNTNIDYNGNNYSGTGSANFEWDVQYAPAGVVKSAYVWYYEANNTIVFFGCNGGSIPCTGVTYDAASKKVNYVNAPFAQITNVFPGPASLVTGGGTITVNGAVSVGALTTAVVGGSCVRPATIAALTFTCTGPTAPTGATVATQADVDAISGDYSIATKDLFVNFSGTAYSNTIAAGGATVIAACKLNNGDVYMTYGTSNRLVFTQTAGVWSVSGTLPAATPPSFNAQTKVSCNF